MMPNPFTEVPEMVALPEPTLTVAPLYIRKPVVVLEAEVEMDSVPPLVAIVELSIEIKPEAVKATFIVPDVALMLVPELMAMPEPAVMVTPPPLEAVSEALLVMLPAALRVSVLPPLQVTGLEMVMLPD